MKRTYKVLRIIAMLAAVAGVGTLLGFVSSLRSTALCEALDVRFEAGEGLLVSDVEVRARAIVDDKMPVGMPLGELDTRRMEEAIAGIPHVQEAVVYKTIDRKLVVELKERAPVLRLLDRNGRSALLDAEGHLLPLSPHAHLRLPVVTGHFSIAPEAIAARTQVTTWQQGEALRDIYDYALALHGQPFWLAQIQHTEYTAQGELVAHPQVGNHSILFGNVDRIGEKLHKLDIFYREGMDAARWNRYSTINLKYKDQIVCTKK